ncbi:MAG TPA: alpha/beta fold hydrolase [Gemmatimonadales bacterium]|nr:alpha/beta fold hydrolase [Gemmatimonadales bacterium]
MKSRVYRVTLAISMASCAAAASAAGQEHQHPPSQPTTIDAQAATPLYENLGTLHHTITTRSALAQKYFDQGLRLTYGFNHAEAIKSFQEGIRHDSTCAMCYWGVAYALGPNINLPMDTSAVRPAYDAARKALEYSSSVSPRERAYIEALSKRYAPEPSANRAPLDSAWAKAIGAVSRRFPRDDDAAALYGEALMDLRPWNYWTNGGRPKAPSTLEALRVLEPVVKRNPGHPGACHFYIHAIEASNDAGKALACAERLGRDMPGAGHLVHMPTHIYIRLGRWDVAADRNAHAVHADEQYISERQPSGVYPMAYYPHNYHMMWYALNMMGRSAEALKAAQGVVKNVPADVVRQVPPLEYFSPTVLYTLARFSRWDDVLREPAPPKDLRYTTGVWHYVRGLAYTGQDKLDSAAVERDKLVAISAATPEGAAANLNSVRSLLAIAENHLRGEMAAEAGRYDESVKHLQKAIAGEDELTYDEPPPWYLPIRQRLGAVLLEAGRPDEAEKAFRADLARRPENGWSLHGLAQSLRAQKRGKEAQGIEARFQRAWSKADVKLASSVRQGDVLLDTGVRLRYPEQGDPAGHPVILLHGYSDSRFSFSSLLPLLPSGYRVYALDLRGHGLSDKPAAGYSMRELAGDVLAFMDAKRVTKATVVGHSMGSFVAQQVAAAAPGRIERLVLVGSATAIHGMNGFTEFQKMVEALQDPVAEKFAREFQVSTIYRPVQPVFLDRAVTESLRLPARVWHALMAGMAATEPATVLGKHRIPTLLIWGDRDSVFPRSEQDALLAMMPSARLKVYEETGHAVHWERPAEVARDLEAFVGVGG